MATTIVTKSGSGAPTASDLVAGELAVDLTNGRLYTEDSGGTVLELGLSPNGNVNVTGSVTADGLTLSDSANPTLTITDTTNPTSLVLTAGNLSTTIGTTTDHPLKFDTNDTERMRIDSSGDLLVGKTAASFGTAGVAVFGSGEIDITNTNEAPLFLNRLGSDGVIQYFYKDGTTVGSILSSGGDGIIVQGVAAGSGLLFHNSDALLPAQNGNAIDATIDLGRTTPSAFRFKDLYLSGGVVFGTTGGSVSSKTLDDYEEGTWTGTATAGAATSISVADEKYTKIGNQVTIQCTINFSGASGVLNIAGLPFATSPACAGIGREDATSGYAIYGRSQSGSATFDLFYAGAVSNATPFQVSAGNMRYSMTYLT